MSDFSAALGKTAAAVEAVLTALTPTPEGPEARLHEAMRYSVLGGGKRIRPFLLTASAALFHVPEDYALRAAAALEMVHGYSLVHDDLPCMDDDDLRRGRPTVHVAFDEATAVLAGDALLTLAFEVMAAKPTHPDGAVRAELVERLAVAAGCAGMAAGQMIDLTAAERDLDAATVVRMQRLKTGALIGFACEAGAILGRADRPERQALTAYAHDLGLAFQIADDLLDVEGDQATVGKAVGKDAAAGKATLVALHGAERARTQAAMLAGQAAKHLDLFANKAEILRQAAAFVVSRGS